MAGLGFNLSLQALVEQLTGTHLPRIVLARTGHVDRFAEEQVAYAARDVVAFAASFTRYCLTAWTNRVKRCGSEERNDHTSKQRAGNA